MTGQRNRGDELTLFLVLIFVGNLLGLVFYFIEAMMDPKILPMATWAIFSLAALSGANCYCAWELWKWKRRGFFGMVVVCVAGLIINIIVNAGYLEAFVGIVMAAILYWLLKPHWATLE
jgi:hypothetical protein